MYILIQKINENPLDPVHNKLKFEGQFGNSFDSLVIKDLLVTLPNHPNDCENFPRVI